MGTVTRPTLKELPVVITGVGTYKARNGLTVVIDEIGDPARSTFNCKGNYYTKQGKRLVSHWNIWHPSGHFEAVSRNHPLDVVRKVRDA